MPFEIIGEITGIKTIARGVSVHQREWLAHRFGPGRWRKVAGSALVRFENGTVGNAELHWFEAHGIGRRVMKVKRRLDSR